MRRRQRPVDGTMALRDHLVELRGRLLKALFFVAIGAVAGWILYPRILDILIQPYCDLPASQRLLSGDGQCKLIFTSPLDGFTLRIKVGAICGVILAAPFWLYQLWAFVTPGLHRREKRWTVAFVFLSSLLFAAGAVISYFTIEKALALLVSFAGDSTVAAIDAQKYISFVTSMLLVFGAAFELPLLVTALNRVGVLPAARLLRWQRLSIFLIFVFAAVATPSTDPISMLMLAIPMSILFEIAILVAWLHDRRKARRDAADPLSQLDDDEISDLDTTVHPVDEPDPSRR
jgi:sec-independent protein translocase protein TatC